MRPAVALIGIGNPYRRDDGVGPAVVTAIGNRRPSGVSITVTGADPSRLLDAWSGADLAVVVDAALCDPATPGRIHRTTVSTPGPGSAAASTHGLGMSDVVRLAEALGRAPRRLVVFVVEAADLGFGPGLSPVVAHAVPVLVRRVLVELGNGDGGGAGTQLPIRTASSPVRRDRISSPARAHRRNGHHPAAGERPSAALGGPLDPVRRCRPLRRSDIDLLGPLIDPGLAKP